MPTPTELMRYSQSRKAVLAAAGLTVPDVYTFWREALSGPSGRPSNSTPNSFGVHNLHVCDYRCFRNLQSISTTWISIMLPTSDVTFRIQLNTNNVCILSRLSHPAACRRWICQESVTGATVFRTLSSRTSDSTMMALMAFLKDLRQCIRTRCIFWN